MATATTDLALRIAAAQELDRRQCAREPVTFIRRHLTLEDNDGHAIPFKLWPFQAQMVRTLHERRAVVVLKARQVGLSWTALAYALWLAVFQQGVRILILCKTETDASHALDRIRRMRDRALADRASAHVFAGLDGARDAVTTLDIGASTIRALVGTPAAARSETAGLVILDEFAFQRGAEEIWRAVLPTMQGGGRLAVVSTGNGTVVAGGTGAEFARQWTRAVSGESGLAHMFFRWDAHPERDEAWRARALAELGDEERFRVEYPTEPADAFIFPDTDLVYDPTHLAAVARAGAEIDALPESHKPSGPLWVGIDWGNHTHVLFARRMAAGGLYVFAEVVDARADLELTLTEVVAVLAPLGERVEFERFDAAEPIVHRSYRGLFRKRYGYNPKWLAIPFGKYKQTAIRYVKLLARRTYEAQKLRTLAISPTGCPELLRQMSVLQWKDDDAGKIEKGDDHGADALLTLVAELAEEFYREKGGA